MVLALPVTTCDPGKVSLPRAWFPNVKNGEITALLCVFLQSGLMSSNMTRSSSRVTWLYLMVM